MDERNEVQRPRSRLKLLASLLLALFAGLVLVGACLSLVVSSTPRHTLEVPTGELSAGAPRFYAQPSFGADANGRTYGVWVLVPDRGATRAFASRADGSDCSVSWRPEVAVGGVTGVFQDACDNSSYDADGRLLAGPALRGLDRFDVEVTASRVVVDLENAHAGTCRRDPAPGVPCSPEPTATAR